MVAEDEKWNCVRAQDENHIFERLPWKERAVKKMWTRVMTTP